MMTGLTTTYLIEIMSNPKTNLGDGGDERHTKPVHAASSPSQFQPQKEGDDTCPTNPSSNINTDAIPQGSNAAQTVQAPSAAEKLIDLIIGDLVRETNIFPNQVERAKKLIGQRLYAQSKALAERSEHPIDEDFIEGRVPPDLGCEQQEWTVEEISLTRPRLASIKCGKSYPLFRGIGIQDAKHIVLAHNAALAAERQRHERIVEQLTACVETSDRELLVAQAAIEQHNNHCKGHPWKDYPVINVDLSLLHQHDAEIRKPLVDALLEIREEMPP